MDRNSDKSLGDLACELKGASSLLSLISPLVEPNGNAESGSIPSKDTLEYAFYSIEATLDRIAEELSGREGLELRAKAG